LQKEKNDIDRQGKPFKFLLRPLFFSFLSVDSRQKEKTGPFVFSING